MVNILHFQELAVQELTVQDLAVQDQTVQEPSGSPVAQKPHKAKRFCIFGPKGAIQIRYYYYYKCKKLWFIHELTAHYTSKTAKITKR